MQITGKSRVCFLLLFFFFKAKKEVKGPSEGLLHNAQGSKAVLSCCFGPVSRSHTVKQLENGFGFGISNTVESSKTITTNLANLKANCSLH